MMELILWRHAEAESGLVDEERKLTRKGKKQARRVAAWLGRRAARRARVLASPARRARQTAKALTLRFDIRPEIGTRACARDLLAAAGWPHGRGTVILVGHQPALGRAAALAVTGRTADWNIRKGGLWWIEAREAGAEVLVRAVIAPDIS
jgi:phosphohistidine phosphatase